MHEFDIGFEDFVIGTIEFNKPKPPTKIRGSQHIRREEKQKPKQIIRKPFTPKPK